MPSSAHSTASVIIRFWTPAFAAAECAVPALPVHAYVAITETIEPRSRPASRYRVANAREQ